MSLRAKLQPPGSRPQKTHEFPFWHQGQQSATELVRDEARLIQSYIVVKTRNIF
jgi:hypothetical protein